MRKTLTAVLFVAVSASFVPGHGAAAVPSAEQQEVLKKKKRQEALKKSLKAEKEAIAKAKAKLKAAQAAKAKREAMVKAKIAADAKARAKIRTDKILAERSDPRVQARRQCGTFLKCLFGNSRRANGRVQTAALSGTGLSGRSLRQTVDWDETRYKPGSLVVRTPERALYYVLPGGEAIRYSVGVGREGFQWSGKSKIVAKQEWPTWRPPSEMIRREAEKGHILPEVMEGGPGNPLGARALYIGGTLFRVHGTNNEASIGGAVSSGCIRMMNADVVDLYGRVKIGSPIYVSQ
jgi:lipoprotein-anchoring transpeptidase ErfK/SrfK